MTSKPDRDYVLDSRGEVVVLRGGFHPDCLPVVRSLFTRAARAKIPMSRLCEHAGVDRATPASWRRGERAPNLGTLERLINALDELAK